jgi:hypothetical protein
MTKDVAQRSPSALLRAVSMSNGRWTFYEAAKNGNQKFVHICSREFAFWATAPQYLPKNSGVIPNDLEKTTLYNFGSVTLLY